MLRYRVTVEFDVEADDPLLVQEKLTALKAIAEIILVKAKSVKEPA